MKKNMGIADRTIRVIIAISLLVLNIRGIISGTVATVAVIVAVIFMVTGFVGFCPLYKLLGVQSARKSHKVVR